VKIIKIGAVWCSSCLIMKSRFNDLIKNMNIEIEELDYDDASEIMDKYGISTDILPIYIREDNSNYIIGEKTKKEILEFIEEK
jgi:Thioredoxin.